MKEYRYKTTFAAKILPIDSEKGQKIVSFASKNSNLSKLLPKDVNLTDNIGFQLFESEAFLVNVLNLNSDGVATAEGIKLKESAPLGFIDLEHERKNLIGVIVDSNYTDIKTGNQLSEADIKDTDNPFAVSITGIIWRAPNPDLADAIANINSKDSELKDEIYCSWEVMFDSFDLLIIDKNKFNFSEGKLISDQGEVEKLSKKLQCYGGSGMTDDGKKIGRVPIGDTVCLGVGLVNHPAGQLSPIVVEDTKESTANIDVSIDIKDINNLDKIIEKKILEVLNNQRDLTNLQNNENKISQAQKVVVNDISNKNNLKMNIKNLAEVTDENIKDLKKSDLEVIFASSTKDLLDSKIKEINDSYLGKLSEKDKAIEAAQKSSTDLSVKIQEISDKLSKASDNLDKMANENAQREQVEAFSARMESIENDFDLDDKQKEIVANKVKTLATDADFTNYLAEIEVLLAAKKKSKKMPPADNKDDTKNDKTDDTKTQAKASVNDTTVIDDALKNGEKDKVVIPNTSVGTETIAQRAAKAFGVDGWTVTNKRKNRV